ncbi:MAG: hypothetical protein WBG86_21380 [Polyangiales bacterium]
MRFSTLLVLATVFAAFAPNVTAAQSVIDPNATVVELRTSCVMPGSTYLDNCFETAADVTDWLWVDAGLPGGRNSEPNSLDSVTVRVGPGTFDAFECDGNGMRGFVSVEGAGRDVTRFVTPSPPVFHPIAGACHGGITSDGCTNLSFRNVTAEGAAGVLWVGDGDSQWEDVDMTAENPTGATCLAEAMAWYDALSLGGEHFFWNTRFRALGKAAFTSAFQTDESDSWIYGSDLLIEMTSDAVVGGATVRSGSDIGVRIFGSTVRARFAASAPSFSGLVTGLLAESDGVIHMHGGIINVSTSLSTSGVAVGVQASAGSFVHTPETAFALSGPTIARLLGAGAIQSPFLWPSGPTPPSIFSQTGSDLFVKTKEGPGQDEARLLVYDNGCSPGPWRRVSNDTCLC